MTGLGLSPNRALDNVPCLCLFVAVPPGKGCFRRCLVAGRHRRARVRLATVGPSEAVVLRSEAERWRPEGLMRCPGRGGHVPWSRVLTDDRDRRGCQARPREAGSRPSSPGRTSGRFCASWVRPRDAVSIRGRLPREVRAQALEALGRQPSLVAPKRGTRDQRHCGARRGRPHAGTACLPVSARPRGRGRPRLAPPSFFSRGSAKAKGLIPEPQGCGDMGACGSA